MLLPSSTTFLETNLFSSPKTVTLWHAGDITLIDFPFPSSKACKSLSMHTV